MKFAVVLPIWQLSTDDADFLTTAAEKLGFDAVLIPDHIVAPPATMEHYGPIWPDIFTLLGYLAARTNRIQLGSSVVVVPYRNPLVVAKCVATVDQVSRGRFIFGIGVGWDEEEFQLLRIPFRERGAMTDEYLRIMKAAWAQEEPRYEGAYFNLAGFKCEPKPVQTPHPPIWVGCSPMTATGVGLRRTAELGDAWHPVFCSMDEIRRGAQLLREYAAKVGRDKPPALAPRNLLNITERPKDGDRGLFEGSPEQIAADIKEMERLGVDYICFDVFSRPTPAGMAGLMEQFMAEVRPLLN